MVVVESADVVSLDGEWLDISGVSAPALEFSGALGEAAGYGVFAVHDYLLGATHFFVSDGWVVDSAVDF